MTVDQEAKLLTWYQQNARELPWRASRELYPVLVSELMLQQTTVAAVVPLYRRWMERFPNLATLAEAPLDAVMQAWSGLGYYHRAKRLHQAAQTLHRSSQPPSSLEQLLELPGLGPYTAAAVASIALGLPHLALDTNVLRVLLRLYGWQQRADAAAVQAALREKVETSLANSDFGITNQALMELGASLCRVRAPSCLVCPLAGDCVALAGSLQEAIPVAKPKTPPRLTRATALILASCDAVLLLRGTSLGLLEELYQPPIDFHDENRPELAITKFVHWLRPYARQATTVGSSVYNISGRRLELTVESLDLEASMVTAAERLGLSVVRWRGSEPLALSSLTRKLLKVWEGSRAALPEPGDRWLPCGP